MIDKEKLKKLKELKKEKESTDNLIKTWKSELEEQIEQIKKENDYDRVKEQIDNLSKEIEEEALQEYKHTGRKKLTGGIGVQVRKVLDYDKDKAFNWAKEHNLCLSLDKKAFEKLAKDQDLDFVDKKEEEKVTWPTKGIKLED